MANRDHSLDEGIDRAATAEFLEKGFEKASLRTIAAAAGVTIGAIYTRYPTKDQLFCAQVQPLLERIGAAFSDIRSGYYGGEVTLAHMAQAMKYESETILHLLFDDYDRATLLLCRSTGSSLEHVFDQVVERKLEETEAFFQQAGGRVPDRRVLKLLISGQFHLYFEIIREGCPLQDARAMMHAAMIYHTGGWMALLGNEEKGEGDK